VNIKKVFPQNLGNSISNFPEGGNMLAEEWVPVEDFDRYEVSNAGRVRNAHTFRIMTGTPNTQGIPNVILTQGTRHYRRAIAPLVARTFLPEHEERHYNTPINLDGNRFNNHVRNLMWRPLWFARLYHAQFKEPWCRDGPIKIVETGEYFDYTSEMLIKYGLLERNILQAARSGEPVLNLGKHVKLC
jgi:hypothetical protein